MKSMTHWVVALLVGIAASMPVLAAESATQKRVPPPKSAPAPSPQTRKPSPGTPPGKAVPRPLAQRPPTHPTHRPPISQMDGRTLIYPYYFDDFDFVYRFPYGIYPYSHYPYSPYGYDLSIPDCVIEEEETQRSGAVRLDIPQKDAVVYVDGFYVGAVSDFNGATEALMLPPGPHRLELRATGYETMIFDVNIRAGRTITYRGPMQPAS